MDVDGDDGYSNDPSMNFTRSPTPVIGNPYSFMGHEPGITTSMNENPYGFTGSIPDKNNSMNENPFTFTGSIPDKNNSMNRVAENSSQETSKDKNQTFLSYEDRDEGESKKANDFFWSFGNQKNSNSSNLSANNQEISEDGKKPSWSDKDSSRSSSSSDSYKTSLQISPRTSPTKRKASSPTTWRSPAATIAMIPPTIFQPDDPLALSTHEDTSLLKSPPTVPPRFPAPSTRNAPQLNPPPSVPQRSASLTSPSDRQRVSKMLKLPPSVAILPPSLPTTSPIVRQRKPSVANLEQTPRRSDRLRERLEKKIEEARSLPKYDETREKMGLPPPMVNLEEKVPRESGIAKKSPVTKKRTVKHLTPQERNDQSPLRKSPRRKSSQKSKPSNVPQVPFDEYKTDDTLKSVSRKNNDV